MDTSKMIDLYAQGSIKKGSPLDAGCPFRGRVPLEDVQWMYDIAQRRGELKKFFTFDLIGYATKDYNHGDVISPDDILWNEGCLLVGVIGGRSPFASSISPFTGWPIS